MTKLTTQQHYDVPGGTLKVVLDTDHTLSAAERERLDGIAAACLAFQADVGVRRRFPSDAVIEAVAGDIDIAIWELGGDQEISAG
jgi:hypothetical protein